MLRYLSPVICWSFTLITPLLSVEIPSDLQKKADYAFQGFDDTIMHINRGVCRIIGETVYPGGKNVIKDDIFIAFDYQNNFYRFDNGNLKRTLLTPDFFYEVWHPDENNVSVKRSLASAPDATSVFCHLIDIQNVYCYVPVGPHKPYAYRHSKFHNQHKEIKKINYEELTNGLVKVTTITHEISLISEFFINTINGYTVQQILYSNGYIFDISWDKINNTWVPVAYVFNSGSDFGVEWKIDWEQVNEVVDPKFFDLDEMLADQEDGALMLSEELGSPPIIIGRVGKGITHISEFPQSNRHTYFRYVLITVGFILILVSLVKMYYDRKKKNAP